SHDLSLIKYLCDETLIMYFGSIVEKGPTEKVLFKPMHPYTAALISAVPSINPDQEMQALNIRNAGGTAGDMSHGCKFRFRCPFARDKCFTDTPQLRSVDSHEVACHFAEE